uniref:uncharacterized protein LOC129502248 isoform X1 n=1 Tax=Nyctereutes procyonoides TaxID=34880 RepID=UPI00244502D0|nr:uncharacterized protein LOC129502248 isoform X1 [Nyctereutes procyonoides]
MDGPRGTVPRLYSLLSSNVVSGLGSPGPPPPAPAVAHRESEGDSSCMPVARPGPLRAGTHRQDGEPHEEADQWINPSCHSAAISPLGRGQQRPKECRTSVRWKLNRESVQKEAGRTFRKPEVTNSQTPSYSGELRGCHPATFPCLDGTFKVPGCLVSAGGHHTDIGFPSTRWTPWHLAGRDSRGPGASRPKAPGPLLHSRDGWLLHTSRVN